MVQDGLCVDHEKTFDLSTKKNVFIVGAGYPEYPDNFASLKMQLQTYFKYPITLCVNETTLFGVPMPEFVKLKEEKLNQVKEAGFEYAKTGAISSELVCNIEKTMIPNESYISMMNSLAPNKD